MRSEAYKISAGRVAKTIAMAWLSDWWWCLALPLAVCGMLAVNDLRWAIVACALIFIVVPGVLALVYFNYALSPEAAKALIPHTVSLSSKGIDVVYLPEEGAWRPNTDFVPWSQVKSVDTTDQGWVIWLKGKRYMHIELPYEALATQEDKRKAYDIIQENCQFGTVFVD